MLLALTLFLNQPQTPAQPKPFELTVDSIMRGPALVGQVPRGFRWSDDGKTLSFTWKSPTDREAHSYVVNADGSHLGPGDDNAELAVTGLPSPSGDAVAYVANKALIVKKGGVPKTIAEEDQDISNVVWTADGKNLAYTAGNEAVLVTLDTGNETLLARYQPGQGENRPPIPQAQTTTEPTPSRKALAAEETELFPGAGSRRGGGFTGNRRGRRGAGGTNNATPPTLKLKDNQSAFGMNASPDGVHTEITVFESTAESTGTEVPNYITATGYTETIPSYPKVGDVHSRSTLVVTTKDGKVAWLTPPDGVGTRDYSVRQSQWSKDGKTLIAMVDTNDHKDRYLVKVDPDTAKSTTLFSDHSDAWLGGPGAGTLAWLPDHNRMYLESEKDGFAHLYTVDISSGEIKQVTSGKFEVSGVQLSHDGKNFFFVSSEGSPFRRHFDEVSVEGGPRTRLLPPDPNETLHGDTQVVLSPDESHAAYLESWVNHPPELFVSEVKPGGKAAKVTESPTAEWLSFKWTKPELVQIPASDGVNVPAHLYKPRHFRRGGPAVIFVHGAGYLQNVHDWWKDSYYLEYMFHHILVAKGVAVLDIDYRASAGYGRDWRTAVYRFMGGRDLDDNVDGATWLVKTQGVDPRRIGIYGGSYGGFITLMAMFTKPGVFAAGAALRPVSDWANYNDGYTSDILNLPQDDKEAYRRSSPIFHAEGLQGSLLICHGVVDTNVHYQDTVRLVQRLIDLRKENWSVAFFPMEDHTFVRPTSWADEYKRILKLFQENLHF